MIGIASEKCWDYNAVIGEASEAVQEQYEAEYPGEKWDQFLFEFHNQTGFPCEIRVVRGGEAVGTLQPNSRVESLVLQLTNILREAKIQWRYLHVEMNPTMNLVRLR